MTDRSLLRAALAERWWVLPDRTFRVAVTLIALADERGGELVVSITSEALARRCVSNRTSLRRALDALTDAGFCSVTARQGNTGRTEIVLRPTSEGRTLSTETLCESPADPRDRGRLIEPDKPPDQSENPDIQTEVLGQNASDSRARDQDLQRSDPDPSLGSDLRSSASRDQSNKSGNAPVAEKRRRVDPAKVPERAWAAADYLRSRVLISNPAAMTGTKPWDSGYQWTAGAGERTGDGSRNGLRLSWADKFRLFHATLTKALQNADANATPEIAWEQIARAVYWLFHKQTGEARFIVECPDSLRDKWDHIQRIMTKDAPQRGANGKPDPIAKREWVSGDDWGKK